MSNRNDHGSPPEDTCSATAAVSLSRSASIAARRLSRLEHAEHNVEEASPTAAHAALDPHAHGVPCGVDMSESSVEEVGLKRTLVQPVMQHAKFDPV